MTVSTRRLAAVAAPLLLALSLSACGGDGADGGDAPEDASSEDFCAVFEDEDRADDADGANDLAEEMAEVGTPESITGDAREGFEITVEFLGDVSDDDVEKFADAQDPAELEDLLGGKEEAEKFGAFLEAQVKECNPELGELPEVPEP